MATYQRSHPSCAPKSPEFDNLEIRCTWSGEYEDQANLRISLDVKCVPNTQLQLLNARAPGVSFRAAFSERLPSSECDSEGPDTGDFPRSPLFGFSLLVSGGDNELGSRSSDGGNSNEVHSPAAEPVSKPTEGANTDGRNTQGNPEYHDTDPAFGSVVSSVCSVGSCTSFPDPESLVKSRKRSAIDADLTDSESESRDKKSNAVLKEITNRGSRHTSPIKASGVGSTRVPSVSTPNEITCPTSPITPVATRIPDLSNGNAGSKSPAKPGATAGAGFSMPNENTCPTSPGRRVPAPYMPNENTSPVKAADGGAVSTERVRLPGLSPQKHSRKPSMIPRPACALEGTATEHSPLSTNSVGTVIGRPTETRSSPEAATDHKSTADIAEPDSSDDQPLSFAPSREKGTCSEWTESDVCNDETPCYTTPRSSGRHSFDQDRNIEKCGASHKPEVNLVDGLLILKNGENVDEATYKVTVTASIYIPYGNDKGWSDLIMSGLRRTGGGRSGFFLFLLPDDHGLEIRTTNLTRSKVVENCFIAEFVNAGNLIIPVRKCDKKFYGVVKDFTVDQEIRVHSSFRVVGNDSHDEQGSVEMRYHAMCSLTLHNRCFWTERCRVLLYLDGGPQGSFHCELEPQKEGLKMIHITAQEDAGIGVSRIQLTCSPKDLEMFCITWVMNVPGKRASCWVPRVYSVSSSTREGSRDYLRVALMEMVGDPPDPPSLPQTPELEGKDIGDTQDEVCHNELVRASTGLRLEREYSTWPRASQVKEVVQLQLDRYIQSVRSCQKRVLAGVLCLVLLLCFITSRVYVSPRVFLEASAQVSSPSSPTHVEISKQTDQPALKDGQGILSDGETTGGLSILKILGRYGVAAVDGDPKLEDSIDYEAEDSEQSVEAGLTFRDRIDYWLGWRGPIE